MIGQQVRNYRIDSLLGTGGMGSVYLATHTQLGRQIAVKVLHPTLAHNPIVRERFRNEAATLSRLHHPNIVSLYDYVEENDALYLFMEYVEGKPLDDYTRTVSGPIPESKAVPLFAKILDAVAYAHDRNVIHRDIKPSNLMINEVGNPKILDFGIAKLVGQTSDGLTQVGTRMGTVLYMSPEQVRGDALDKRSDIYSLGITLQQILTGRSPYDEPNISEYMVYQRILHDPLPAMRTIYPGVSDHIQAIVDQATAKNPADRFSDCHAFREALLSPARYSAQPVPNNQVLNRPPAPVLAHTVVNIPAKTQVVAPKKSRSYVWVGTLLAAAIIISLIGIIIATLDTSASKTNRRRESPIVADTTRRHPANSTPPQEEATAVDTDQPEETPPDSLAADTTATEQTDEIPLPSVAQPAWMDKITVEYESVPPSAEEAGSTTNRFALKIVLTNTAPDINFNNVTLRIRFLNQDEQVVGTYLYEHGHLPAGAIERFNVERRVQAANATCEVISAELE